MGNLLFRIERRMQAIYRGCLRVIIGMHKRDKNLVVYGGALDLFIDNAKHLFIYNSENMPSCRHVWLSRNEQIIRHIRDIGFEAVNSTTKEGKSLMRNAGMVIYDNRIDEFSDHTLSQGAIRLELWHGVPCCKRIGKARVNENDPFIIQSKFKYKYLMEHIYGDYVLSTSVISNNIFSAAFELPVENIIISGYPRCRFMFMNIEQISTYIYKYEDYYTQHLFEELKKQTGHKKVIYMPTFRDSDPNYITKAFPNWEEFNRFCIRNNIIFYVKVHRVTPLPQNRDFSNVKFLDSHLDVYPILGLFDILVTDYSSIMYEFALLNKPILLYTFDMEEYIRNSREIHQQFIDLIRKLNNVDNVGELETYLISEKIKQMSFPAHKYFDTPENFETLSSFIARSTLV